MTPLTAAQQRELANAFFDVLHATAPPQVIDRLRVRLRELGSNVGDEVRQFRQLQKACAEHPPLNAALQTAGFGDIAAMDPVRVAPETGRVVQVFNMVVEDLCGDLEHTHFRRVIYTRDDLESV